jgi:hypothetical protein
VAGGEEAEALRKDKRVFELRARVLASGGGVSWLGLTWGGFDVSRFSDVQLTGVTARGFLLSLKVHGWEDMGHTMK